MTPMSMQALLTVALTVAPLVHASNGIVKFAERSGGADLFLSDQNVEASVAGVQVADDASGLFVSSAEALGDKITAGFEVLTNGRATTGYKNTTYTGFTDAFCPVTREARSIPGFLFSLPGPVDKVSADSIKVVQMNPVASQTRPALSLVTNPAGALKAPGIAYNFSERHSIGFSPTIALEIFRAYGLDSFTDLSGDLSSLTSRGNDDPRGTEIFGGSGYSAEDKMELYAVEINYGWLF